MINQSAKLWPEAKLQNGIWIRRVSLWTGLVLYVFLVTHLSNHALGLISLEAMEAGRLWFLAVWRNPFGSVVLYGSLTFHVILTLFTIYQRRSLRMPFWQAVQILLGLIIPLFLISHMSATRLAYEWFGRIDSYARLGHVYWVVNPTTTGAKQVILLLIAWTHGCIGIHYWLRVKSWYTRSFPYIFGGFLLVVVLALLGVAHWGREVVRLSSQPGWTAKMRQETKGLRPYKRSEIIPVRDGVWYGYLFLLAFVLSARLVRGALEGGRRTIRITYADGREVVVPMGFTLLEASRKAKIPHVSVCGGRGRCSTCRVRILEGLDTLPAPNLEEQSVLDRLGAPPNMRLACQLRPANHLTVAPVLLTVVDTGEAFDQQGYGSGSEQEVAILFADLRGFTRLTENKLPYDVVFFLNRYFDVMGDAINRAGGIVNQFTGDGIMALFGVEDSSQKGSRNALAAACAMVEKLGEMSESLKEEFSEQLRMGIGIHTGPTVVGRMGRGVAMYLTAVGDTVHVASRLQDLTKEYQCQLVISAQVAEHAGLDVTAFPKHELTVRNRREPIIIRTIEDVKRLAGLLSKVET